MYMKVTILLEQRSGTGGSGAACGSLFVKFGNLWYIIFMYISTKSLTQILPYICYMFFVRIDLGYLFIIYLQYLKILLIAILFWYF